MVVDKPPVNGKQHPLTIGAGNGRRAAAALECAIEEYRFSDPALAAQALATAVAAELSRVLAERGQAVLAVSGGRSPVTFFETLAEISIDWARVTITLVDERWVAPDSADSNEALVRAHLLQDRAAAASFVPLKTAHATPTAALADRSAALPLPLDVVVLGMGSDGHTASLFPGAPGLHAALDPFSGAALAAIDPPAAPCSRISLTLAALRTAERIFIQLQGAEKIAVLARVRRGDSALPMAVVLEMRACPVSIFITE
jgi:6-phosphogluconolactonase